MATKHRKRVSARSVVAQIPHLCSLYVKVLLGERKRSIDNNIKDADEYVEVANRGQKLNGCFVVVLCLSICTTYTDFMTHYTQLFETHTIYHPTRKR